MFDYLFETTPDAETQQRILAETFLHYHEHLNPGFLTHKRSVKYDAQGVEWRGEGVYMYDITGHRFLDFLGGYGVFALGHRHPHVIRRVEQALERIGLYSQELLNPLQAVLAHQIALRAPGDLQYVYYHGGGAESNDAALKMARLATGRMGHTYFTNAFHGKTFGALSATHRHGLRQHFEPLVYGFKLAPYNDTQYLDSYVSEKTASVIIEVVQGEGGIRAASREFLQALRARCTQVGALLHVDEVQSGWGRSGRFFACEHFELEPDIITMGKAMGGGIMPISALIANPRAFKGMERNPWWLSNTFAGAQPACAAALATIEVFEAENLLEQSRRKGEKLLAGMRDIVGRHLGVLIEARGIGLWVGLECATPELGTRLADELFKRGVLVAQTINAAAVLRFQPPLIVTDEQLDEALQAVADGAAALAANPVGEVGGSGSGPA